MKSRARRAVASLCVLAGSGALATTLAGVPAGAQTDPSSAAEAQSAPGSGNLSLTVLPTTTTTSTTSPTITIPAPTTTTTTAPAPAPKPPRTTTTTRKGPPPTGVPSVPVGGPATSTTLKPGPPAPPPNPAPALLAVQEDLDQLTAISDYKPAQAAVAASQRAVTVAGATLLAAQNDVAAANRAQAAAQKQVGSADHQLANLAIAAYIGVGYPTIEAQPPSLGANGPGTVATPGGLTGFAAADAQEMLQVVAHRTRQNVTDANHQLALAKKATLAAQKVANRDRAQVATAETNLLSAQETLKLITEAATSPGAAGAIDLPNFSAHSTPAKKPSTTTTTAASLAVATIGTTVTLPPPTSPSILGRSAMTGKELAAWFATTRRQAHITVPMAKLADDYQAWGEKTGVRYDLAFAQSIVETGFFSFPSFGQLTPKDNNFAGIGACDTCSHGWTFKDAASGVGAQLELLYEYATTKPLPKGLPNEIGAAGIGGCCSTWMALAGRWASSLVYGISIMTVYNRMLSWVIPQRLEAAGLIAPKSAAARGPELAPLPGSKPASSSAATTPAAPGRTSAASLHR